MPQKTPLRTYTYMLLVSQLFPCWLIPYIIYVQWGHLSLPFSLYKFKIFWDRCRKQDWVRVSTSFRSCIHYWENLLIQIYSSLEASWILWQLHSKMSEIQGSICEMLHIYCPHFMCESMHGSYATSYSYVPSFILDSLYTKLDRGPVTVYNRPFPTQSYKWNLRPRGDEMNFSFFFNSRSDSSL